MPMGCDSSCKTFGAFTTAIKEWITQEKLGRANLLLRLLVNCLLI